MLFGRIALTTLCPLGSPEGFYNLLLQERDLAMRVFRGLCYPTLFYPTPQTKQAIALTTSFKGSSCGCATALLVVRVQAAMLSELLP